MHGAILAELKTYVAETLGEEAWGAILTETGLEPKIYLALQIYPDEEAVALISGASKVTGKSVQEILKDFGHFIAPDLIGMYKHLIKPHWNTLDLIEHTEETIHHLVRIREPGAEPPRLKCKRVSADEVTIVYDSPRKMCALALGIASGIARHFNEKIALTETSCMLKGAPSCNISVRLVRE